MAVSTVKFLLECMNEFYKSFCNLNNQENLHGFISASAPMYNIGDPGKIVSTLHSCGNDITLSTSTFFTS